MVTPTISAAGPADADEVWLRYVEPARWPQWAPQIRDVQASSPRLVTGATGAVIGPLGLSIPFVISEVDDQRRRWAWRVFPGLVEIELEHGVECSGEGTRSWLRITVPALFWPVTVAYLPLAYVALRRLVQ